MHEDLYILSDQVFGWDSDYRVLRDAGVEGVRAHPGTYASGVLGTVWDELAKAQFRPEGSSDAHAHRRRSGRPRAAFPSPTEGEPIPAGQVVWISRPDQSIRQVWTSATDWHFEFDDPAQRVRFREIEAKRDALFDVASRTVPGTRSSRSASTSSLAGFRGPGCGSSSVSPASRSGDREERQRSSPSLWQASASSS